MALLSPIRVGIVGTGIMGGYHTRVASMSDRCQLVGIFDVDAARTDKTAAQWLLNPWQQLITESEQKLDFGVATAQYIFEQHHGSLTVTSYGSVLAIVCRLPLLNNTDSTEGLWNGTEKSSYR